MNFVFSEEASGGIVFVIINWEHTKSIWIIFPKSYYQHTLSQLNLAMLHWCANPLPEPMLIKWQSRAWGYSYIYVIYNVSQHRWIRELQLFIVHNTNPGTPHIIHYSDISWAWFHYKSPVTCPFDQQNFHAKIKTNIENTEYIYVRRWFVDSSHKWTTIRNTCPWIDQTSWTRSHFKAKRTEYQPVTSAWYCQNITPGCVPRLFPRWLCNISTRRAVQSAIDLQNWKPKQGWF